MASAMSEVWWTQIPWQALAAGAAVLISASSPTWLRWLQSKDDKGKMQLEAATREQDRADARLVRAYEEAIKDRDREEAGRINAEKESHFQAKLVGFYYWRAKQLVHDLKNARQLADFLFARLEKIGAVEGIPAPVWELVPVIPDDMETVMDRIAKGKM